MICQFVDNEFIHINISHYYVVDVGVVYLYLCDYAAFLVFSTVQKQSCCKKNVSKNL